MKAILTISFIALFTASISAQETWRIVEDSDLEKLIYTNVFNVNDKIYTF